MNRVNKYFRIAKRNALKGDDKSIKRQYKIGAVGIRTDGTVVVSNNIPAQNPTREAHAEARLVRKLNWGSVVFVVRVLSNGKLSKSYPCSNCISSMKLRGISKCYYSINDIEYGVISL